jgi:hypothetical protein
LRYKLWRPTHFHLILRDIVSAASQPERDHKSHLEAAIAWLCRAQDVRANEPDSGGVSAGWSFEDGWLPSYPETSGYIIETFLAAASTLNRPELIDRAHRVLDWELTIQNPDGSFPGHFGEPGSRPVIFNTGQIMHGMVAGYLQLGRQECMDSAMRAGAWLMDKQDEDGCWRRSVHNDVPHTYNTRTAWALLRVGKLAGEQDQIGSAVRNLEWALTQVTECGWYRQNAFVDGTAPFTHTIAYAVRGLLESGLILDNERFVNSAVQAAESMAELQRENGWLAGAYDDDWQSKGRFCCLTGLAQFALIWQRMCQSGIEEDVQVNVERALGFLKRNHHVTGTGGPERGAIAGSLPIWGRYSRFEYPNWAVKFFADALIMEMEDVPIPSVAVHSVPTMVGGASA